MEEEARVDYAARADVELECKDGVRLLAHSHILTAHSGVLNRCPPHEGGGRVSQRIPWAEHSADVVIAFLTNCYGGPEPEEWQTDRDRDVNIAGVLELANKLDAPRVTSSALGMVEKAYVNILISNLPYATLAFMVNLNPMPKDVQEVFDWLINMINLNSHSDGMEHLQRLDKASLLALWQNKQTHLRFKLCGDPQYCHAFGQGYSVQLRRVSEEDLMSDSDEPELEEELMLHFCTDRWVQFTMRVWCDGKNMGEYTWEKQVSVETERFCCEERPLEVLVHVTGMRVLIPLPVM